MATAAAALAYFAILLVSFLAARKIVALRGLKGAIGLAMCWAALLAVFAYAPSLAPFVPLDQSLSFAIAQMVLAGSAFGIPAGAYDRLRHRNKRPPSGE
jgi:hypothetical protein